MINTNFTPSFYDILHQLDIIENSLRNRLLSIEKDWNFINELRNKFDFPFFSNLRCGEWYTNSNDQTCYFKSTDGHVHNTHFSLQRLNLHVAFTASKQGGVCIVDSSRHKTIPNSFSHTLPLWTCVLNHLICYFDSNKKQNWDLNLYTPGSSFISSIEEFLIKDRVLTSVESLVSLIDHDILLKLSKSLQYPLRCFWVVRETFSTYNILPFSCINQYHFTPIICISASCREMNAQRQEGDWQYVSGAGDDVDNWSMGLTPLIYQKFHHEIIDMALHNSSSDDLIDFIKNLIQIEQNTINDNIISNLSLPSINNPIMIGDTGLHISHSKYFLSLLSSFPSIIMCCDSVINFNQFQNQYSSLSSKITSNCSVYFFLIENYKKKHLSLYHQLTSIIKYSQQITSTNNLKPILLILSNDQNISVVIALSLLLSSFQSFLPSNLQSNQKNKNYIRSILAFIQQFVPSSYPPKSLMVQLNRYFISPSVLLN